MNMIYKNTTGRLCMVAFGIVINIVCTFIGITLRLPLYLDSIGTVLITSMFGIKYGIIAGVTGALISGFTFDVYSLYFFPVQILTACMAGLMLKTKWLTGWRLPFGSIVVCLPTALLSAAIAAQVFGGLTSAGSSYIVVLMNGLGVNLTFACLIVQILTEYVDKTIAVVLSKAVLRKGVYIGIYGQI